MTRAARRSRRRPLVLAPLSLVLVTAAARAENDPPPRIPLSEGSVGLAINVTSSGGKSWGGAGAIGRGAFCYLACLFQDRVKDRVMFGELLALDAGLGYQSLEGENLGSAWLNLAFSVGAQVTVEATPDLELGLRYYFLAQWNTLRPIRAQDEYFIVEPEARFRRVLAQVGFRTTWPFNYGPGTGFELLAELKYLLHGSTYVGVSEEYVSIPDVTFTNGPTTFSTLTTNVVRLVYGWVL